MRLKGINFSFLAILIILTIASCDSEGYRFRKSSVLTDSLNQSRFIIHKQFDKIKDTVQVVDKDSLIGIWYDSILLIKEDGSWNGMRPIDKRIELKLFSSSKYEWTEKNTFSKLDTVKYGQYWTSNFNDSSYLQLIFNMNGDTIFEQGDTAFSNSYLIDYFKKDTLWIRSFGSYDHTTIDEAQLFIRKN